MHASIAATANATWGGKGTPNAKQVKNELVPVVCAFFREDNLGLASLLFIAFLFALVFLVLFPAYVVLGLLPG